MSQQLSSLEPFPSRAASLSATAHLLHPAASLEAALSGLRPGFHALGLLLGLHHWEPSRKGGRRQGDHGACKAALSTCGSAKAPPGAGASTATGQAGQALWLPYLASYSFLNVFFFN